MTYEYIYAPTMDMTTVMWGREKHSLESNQERSDADYLPSVKRDTKNVYVLDHAVLKPTKKTKRDTMKMYVKIGVWCAFSVMAIIPPLMSVLGVVPFDVILTSLGAILAVVMTTVSSRAIYTIRKRDKWRENEKSFEAHNVVGVPIHYRRDYNDEYPSYDPRIKESPELIETYNEIEKLFGLHFYDDIDLLKCPQKLGNRHDSELGLSVFVIIIHSMHASRILGTMEYTDKLLGALVELGNQYEFFGMNNIRREFILESRKKAIETLEKGIRNTYREMMSEVMNTKRNYFESDMLMISAQSEASSAYWSSVLGVSAEPSFTPNPSDDTMGDTK